VSLDTPAPPAPLCAVPQPPGSGVPAPCRLSLLAALTASAIELGIMRFNPFLPEGHAWTSALTNAFALALLLAPSLYFLLFRPLDRTVAACRRAEKALESGGEPGTAPLERFDWADEELLRPARRLSALRLTLFAALAVFCAEMLLMRLVPSLAEVHPWPLAAIDAAALVALVAPALYAFVFRPLGTAFEECRRASESLRRAKIASDRALRARGAELAAANERLAAEIEERRRVEDALRASEEIYRSLVETMNEGLCLVDPAGLISYVNEKLTIMMGYAKEEMIGRSPADFLDEEGRRLFAVQLAKRREGNREPYEITWLRKGGARVPTLVSPKALFDANSGFTGSFAVVTDVSELKRKEEKLVQWRKHLQLMSAQLMAAQEKERARIARELHDGLGQTLTAVKFLLEGIRLRASSGPLSAEESVELTIRKLQEAVEEVRSIGMALRPSILDDLGLVATIRWFCREFQATYPAIALEATVGFQEQDVPEPLKIVLFRILQEATNNVAKHSGARRAWVELRREDGSIWLEVGDDGIGFDVNAASTVPAEKRRLGLDSMRERVLLSGGRCWIEASQGKGTVIRATWSEEALARGEGSALDDLEVS
jgi:PAS domain S-box-containing protein